MQSVGHERACISTTSNEMERELGRRDRDVVRVGVGERRTLKVRLERWTALRAVAIQYVQVSMLQGLRRSWSLPR